MSENAGEADLAEALAGLSTLLTGPDRLVETLTRVAEFAVQAIPGADGAGLTLLRGEHAQTVVASTAFVQKIDEVQYGIGEGPCITAVRERQSVTAGSLGGDPRWPHFGPRIGRMGVHSVLSLPLLVNEQTLGAMNVYAHGKDAFTPAAVRLGELFAVPAAVSVSNAHLLANTQRLVDQLTEALTSRATIDQALGLIMSRTGASPAEAFDRLRAMSQRRAAKVSVLAQELLSEAIARARARHSPPKVPADDSERNGD